MPEECSFIGMTLGEVGKDTGEKMMIFGFIKKDGKVMTLTGIIWCGLEPLFGESGSGGSQGDHGSTGLRLKRNCARGLIISKGRMSISPRWW